MNWTSSSTIIELDIKFTVVFSKNVETVLDISLDIHEYVATSAHSLDGFHTNVLHVQF